MTCTTARVSQPPVRTVARGIKWIPSIIDYRSNRNPYHGDFVEIHLQPDDLGVDRVAADDPADAEVAQSVETLDGVPGPVRVQKILPVGVDGERGEQHVPRV